MGGAERSLRALARALAVPATGVDQVRSAALARAARVPASSAGRRTPGHYDDGRASRKLKRKPRKAFLFVQIQCVTHGARDWLHTCSMHTLQTFIQS